MNAGRIEQMGAPERPLRVAPHHLRGQLPRPVQPGRRRAAGSPRRGRRRGRATGRRRVPVRALPRRAPSDELLVGVRPEKIRLAPRHPEPRPADNVARPAARGDRRQSTSGVSHPVPGPDAVGAGPHRLRAEPRWPGACRRRRRRSSCAGSPTHTFGLAGDAEAGGRGRPEDARRLERGAGLRTHGGLVAAVVAATPGAAPAAAPAADRSVGAGRRTCCSPGHALAGAVLPMPILTLFATSPAEPARRRRHRRVPARPPSRQLRRGDRRLPAAVRCGPSCTPASRRCSRC